MQPHQLRVVDEQKELGDKVNKLTAFIETSPIFATLTGNEQSLLKGQLRAMRDYYTILGMRISLFKVTQ